MTAPPRNPDRPLTREALKTPRAAAIAEIVFAVLFTISIVLARLAVPAELGAPDASAWLEANLRKVQLALALLPFAGIAFLWFVVWCATGLAQARISSSRPSASTASAGR